MRNNPPAIHSVTTLAAAWQMSTAEISAAAQRAGVQPYQRINNTDYYRATDTNKIIMRVAEEAAPDQATASTATVAVDGSRTSLTRHIAGSSVDLSEAAIKPIDELIAANKTAMEAATSATTRYEYRAKIRELQTRRAAVQNSVRRPKPSST